MVLVVKCLICQKELTYTKGNPSPLVAHVKFDHPNLNQKKTFTEVNKKETFDKAVETSLDRNSKNIFTLINKSAQTDDIYFKMNQDSPNDSALDFTLHHGPRDDKDKTLNETKFHDAHEVSSKSFHPDKSRKKEINKTVFEDAQSSESAENFTLLRPQETSSPIHEASISRKNVTERSPLIHNLDSKKVHEDTRRGHQRPENLQKIYYKTSIERWKSVGDKKIHCPRCQAYKRPIVKAHKEHSTESSVFSAFLAACFPLYCSPCCVLPPPKFEYLHCPICDFHLGIYDHQKNIVFPNPNIEREF